jgi:hypothetical protein
MAVHVLVFLGGEWFGSMTFWGWNPEWLSHLNYRCLQPEGGSHFDVMPDAGDCCRTIGVLVWLGSGRNEWRASGEGWGPEKGYNSLLRCVM